jgi:hypothetical protein
VTLHIKTGPKFAFEVVENMVFENVVMNFTDSFLMYNDDPQDCLRTREQ